MKQKIHLVTLNIRNMSLKTIKKAFGDAEK